MPLSAVRALNAKNDGFAPALGAYAAAMALPWNVPVSTSSTPPTASVYGGFALRAARPPLMCNGDLSNLIALDLPSNTPMSMNPSNDTASVGPPNANPARRCEASHPGASSTNPSSVATACGTRRTPTRGTGTADTAPSRTGMARPSPSRRAGSSSRLGLSGRTGTTNGPPDQAPPGRTSQVPSDSPSSGKATVTPLAAASRSDT